MEYSVTLLLCLRLLGRCGWWRKSNWVGWCSLLNSICLVTGDIFVYLRFILDAKSLSQLYCWGLPFLQCYSSVHCLCRWEWWWTLGGRAGRRLPRWEKWSLPGNRTTAWIEFLDSWKNFLHTKVLLQARAAEFLDRKITWKIDSWKDGKSVK